MDAFPDYNEQDLGQDFVFESDAESLQRILDNRELSPRSVLAMRMSSKMIMPTVSPVKGAPRQVRDHPDKFDFFQSKHGDVFWRPKTPRSNTKGANTNAGQQQQNGGRRRALGRVVVNALPQRLLPQRHDTIDPLRTTMSSRKPLINPANNKSKGRRSCMPNLVSLPPPRLSISERKAVPGLDTLPSRLPRANPSARKELDFNMEEDKENEDSAFAKPLPVPPVKETTTIEEKRSLAKMIMMRESLAGLPRASLSGLFRQSLSIAELDRMFEDDSTQSFEDLERRLKTPGKTKAVSRVTAFTPKIKSLLTNHKRASADEKPEELMLESEKKLDSSIPPPICAPEVEKQPLPNSADYPESEPVEAEAMAVDQIGVTENINAIPTDIDGMEIVNVEVFEYDIDESFEDEEEIERKLLQKSMSMVNLSVAVDEEAEKEDKVVVLARSTSLTDICDLNPDSSFLKSAVEALEEHRQEQAAIEKQIQDLMEKSLRRREQFRAVWGVSPRSINQKRDFKTVIHVQNIGFSEDANRDQPNEEEEEEAEEEEVFGEKTPSKKVADNDEENDQEPPMDSQLFQQLIEANFPEQNISYAAHNFTGIDVSMPFDVSNLDNIFIDPSNDPMTINASAQQPDSSTLERPPPEHDIDMEIEELESEVRTMSLLQAARQFHMEEKGKKPPKKTVRFLNATPRSESIEEVNCNMDEDSPKKVTINVAKNSSVVHTPVPKHAKFKMSHDDEDEETFFAAHEKTPPMPTPMAMRNISQKAQESLAQLYNDDFTDELKPKELSFDDDDSVNAS